MTAAVAIVNLILGVAYCGYGVMTVIEMRRDWHSFGFSHFGLAWIFMAFTCGPHHFFHGVHLAMEGRVGGGLDLLSVVVGLPVGVLWLGLRIESFMGKHGDRFVYGTPRWMRVVPALTAVYFGGMTVAAVSMVTGSGSYSSAVAPNVLLVAIYMAIGFFVLRTQLSNRDDMGGWSVSGLCLSAIFPTCALMHAVFMAYALQGQYHHDIHGLAIDWLSVPAGLYFLSVVRGLYRDSLHDWNEGPSVVTEAVAA